MYNEWMANIHTDLVHEPLPAKATTVVDAGAHCE